MEIKRCYKCRETKPTTEFYKDKYSKDGIATSCKTCRNEYVKKWYKSNPDRRKKHQIKWDKSNLDKRCALEARRRARKLKATPDWLTPTDHLLMEHMYAQRDAMTKSTGVVHHVDHIVPLKGKNICGLHVPWNLRVIPAEENRRKGNQVLTEEELNGYGT